MTMGFWIFESLFHKYIFHDEKLELFPTDPNEIWMRMIIIFLIFASGVVIGIQNNKLIENEREKLRVFRAAVRSSQHILNNHLNQMQYFMLKAEDAGLVDPNLKQLYQDSLAESCCLLKNLSQVENPNENTIEDAVQPWKQEVLV